MSFCILYHVVLVKHILYNITAVGEEGLLAYCDLMSFEFHYNILFILTLTSFFSPFDIILKLK